MVVVQLYPTIESICALTSLRPAYLFHLVVQIESVVHQSSRNSAASSGTGRDDTDHHKLSSLTQSIIKMPVRSLSRRLHRTFL
jgi:hypothetical protein